MKTVTIIEHTDEDKKLIGTPLPPNPCDTCKIGADALMCANTPKM